MIVNSIEKNVLCFPLGVTPNEVEITTESKSSTKFAMYFTLYRLYHHRLLKIFS